MTEESADERRVDVDIEEGEFDDLPSTGIPVVHHLNFGMTGSFPLRLADVFFCEDGIYIVEYGNITPIFGLASKRHRREADVMQTIYEYHGVDEVLLQADFVAWINYENVDQIRVYEGGRFGRAKIGIDTTDAKSYTYRIHDEFTPEELQTVIENLASKNEFETNYSSGYGIEIGK